MNPHQLKRLFPNASTSALAANASDYGKPNDNHSSTKLPLPQPEQQATALERQDAGEKDMPPSLIGSDGSRVSVGITLFRVRLLDPDNKYSACKDLIDGLRYAALLRDDKEEDITLEVTQERVKHFADERTVVTITYP